MVSINLLSFVTLAIASVHAASDSQRGAPNIISSAWKLIGDVVAPSESFDFTMSLQGQDMAGLEQRLYDIADANDGSWLDTDTLATYAGASSASQDKVKQYLVSQGVDSDSISFSKLGDHVRVKSNVGLVNKIFSTTLKSWQYQSGKSVPRTKEYTVSSEISDLVINVSPLSSFQQIKHLAPVPKPRPDLASARRSIESRDTPASCNTSEVTPKCLRELYGTIDYKPSKSTGDSPDVGIMEYIGQSFNQPDLDKFLAKYRSDIGSYKMPITNTMGALNLPLLGLAASAESMLDTETITSQVYPNSIHLYDLGNTLTQGDIFDLTFQQFIEDDNRPEVVSISYGSDESDMTAAEAKTMCDDAAKLTALGTTIVVSSGDDGVAGDGQTDCTKRFIPTYPGGCPYILSVGATQRFSPEEMVDTKLAGFYSGSGFSDIFPIPSYQSSEVAAYQKTIPSSLDGKYNTSGRGFPDVTAQGSLYSVIVSGSDELVGGTSASAPAFASVLTLVNDARKAAGKGTIGFAHPQLYKSQSAFNDVTKGGSYGCGSDKSLGFDAGSGWDVSSGLGTPNFSKLRDVFGA